jgi:hypothetical protein
MKLKNTKNTNNAHMTPITTSTNTEIAMHPKTIKKTKPAKNNPASIAPVTAATTTPSITSSTTAVPNAGLGALVVEIANFLDGAEARLGPEPPALTGVQKKRTAKPRKGADQILSVLAPIVQQHKLESPNLSTKTMLARQATASTLKPLQLRLQKLQKRVADEAFNAQTDAWSMALQFYSLVRSRAKSDGQVAASIEPLKSMFGYRHPVVKAGKPTKATTRAKKDLKESLAFATKHGVAQAVLEAEGARPAPAALAPAVGPVSAAPSSIGATPVQAPAAATPVIAAQSPSGAQAAPGGSVVSGNAGTAASAAGSGGAAPNGVAQTGNGVGGVAHA